MSQQASAAGAATPSSDQLQSLVEGALSNMLGADPRAAMNDAANEAVTASLTQADTLLKRLTENAEFLTNQQRVAMATLWSPAMATNSAPGQGIIHPNQNQAPPGGQEVIVLDPSEEVEMTAAEEVEMQAALVSMSAPSAPPAPQNWIPSGTPGASRCMGRSVPRGQCSRGRSGPSSDENVWRS